MLLICRSILDRQSTASGESEGSTYKPVVHKMCFADPKGPSNFTHGFHRYTAVIAVLEFAYFFLIKRVMSF